MALELNKREQPAYAARVITELKFTDESTKIRFSTDNGSLHVYVDNWASHEDPLSIVELEQIREALGRFIEALIPEEVK